jgi:hypothetical protein
LNFQLYTSNITSAVYTLQAVDAFDVNNNETIGTVVGNTLTFEDLDITAGTWSEFNAEINGTQEYKIVVSNVVEANPVVDTEITIEFSTSNTNSVVYSSDDPDQSVAGDGLGAYSINYILPDDINLGTWERDN